MPVRLGVDRGERRESSATRAVVHAAAGRCSRRSLDLTRRIHDDFTFDPKATTVDDAACATCCQLRRGVCQDFARLEIACLRSLGLAARYVSGYLETVPPPGAPRLAGADASHAWLAVYCPGARLDGRRPHEQHVPVDDPRDARPGDATTPT